MAYKLIGGKVREIDTLLFRADTTTDLAQILIDNPNIEGLKAKCEVVADGSYHKLNSAKVWVAQP